ncbi:MAG: protoheme IX farnesyltransferase [Rhodospirillales bacterium 20-60-12]|nr:MAG: protoheme IX farnesyltransferase [Rhodospirillales bacterium 20-60-12]HQT66339.1 heme o synthase [Acetobacteraceae bacterium]
MSDSVITPLLAHGETAFTADEMRLMGTTAQDWLALLKPRVMSLVVYSAIAGMLVAPVPINPVMGAIAIICIATAAGASGAINMWYDRDIDALMRRTANRPIPAGRISPAGALGFGLTLAASSVVLMALATNMLAAVILAGSIGFYVFIYTMWLKRSTPQNIVIGGAAGAFPPMIGWVAATGSLSVMPVLLFAIIFFWTPPHFWSLSLFASADYERAGVPMLPVIAGAKSTRRHVMAYTLLMVPVTLLPTLLGYAGYVYGAAALALGLVFVWYSWRVLRDDQDVSGVSLTKNLPARQAFKYSILYLFILFGVLVADKFIGF